ncbi:MAG: hypothetical protein AAGA54_19475 [Myxococcota bacterium]
MMLRTLALTSLLSIGCAHAATPTPAEPSSAATPSAPEPEPSREAGSIGTTKEPGPQRGAVQLSLDWDQSVVFELPEGVTLQPADGPGDWFRWDDPSIDAHILAASTRDDRPLPQLAGDVFGSLGIQLAEPLGDGQPIVCVEKTRGAVWAFGSEAGSVALLAFQREQGRAFLLIGGPPGSTAAPGGALFEQIKSTLRIQPVMGGDPIPVGQCSEPTASS